MSPTARRAVAAESFGNCAECLGRLGAGSSIFAITRGQWSMIDAILHTIDCCPEPVHISLWTWTIAAYEVDVVTRLRLDGRIAAATLVIDAGARNKNADIIRDWQSTFGPSSVRYVVNHSKIARIGSGDLKFLLRGSMNLNANPRFEQFDLTEGGPEYDLVERIESELPVLADNCHSSKPRDASKLGEAFTPDDLALFGGFKRWAK